MLMCVCIICKIRQSPRVKKALVIMCLRFFSCRVCLGARRTRTTNTAVSFSSFFRFSWRPLCVLASARNAFTACNHSMSGGRPVQRPRGQIWQPAARLPFTFTPVITAVADEACFISLLLTEGKTHPRETPLASAPAHRSSITLWFSLLKTR